MNARLVAPWLLILGCAGPQPSAPDDSDGETDAGQADTDVPADEEGELLTPKPGVVIDQASPTWFAVAGQSVVCLLVRDLAEIEVEVILLGMTDGAMHTWIYGLSLPDGATSFTSSHNVDLVGDELYITRLHEVRAVDLRTADWRPNRPVGTSSFGRFGDSFTDGMMVWRSWDEIGSPLVGRSLDGGLVVTDDVALYQSAPDARVLRRVRGPEDRPGEFVVPRVRDEDLMAADIVGLQTVTWWKGALGSKTAVLADGDGRVRARHEVPSASSYQGIACQPGPLL